MSTKPGFPYSDNKIATYLTRQIEALQSYKTQREIAAEIGYEKPNMISMFKRGEAKVPLEKIPALAKAINVDPAFLFRLALEQYWPDLHREIGAVFGTVVSKNECEFLNAIRAATENQDPVMTPELQDQIQSIFRKEAA